MARKIIKRSAFFVTCMFLLLSLCIVTVRGVVADDDTSNEETDGEVAANDESQQSSEVGDSQETEEDEPETVLGKALKAQNDANKEITDSLSDLNSKLQNILSLE